MRIIAGQCRSRVLKAPAGMATRPTSDRLRESLFNVLAPRMEGCAFADLYAGSGAVGLEALSRGAARVVCVERAPAALKALRENMARLGVTEGMRVEAASVPAWLKRVHGAERFDVVFLDPPYDAEEEYERTLGALGDVTAGLLSEAGIVIAEHRRKQKLQDAYGVLRRVRLLEQGDAALSFFTAEP